MQKCIRRKERCRVSGVEILQQAKITRGRILLSSNLSQILNKSYDILWPKIDFCVSIVGFFFYFILWFVLLADFWGKPRKNEQNPKEIVKCGKVWREIRKNEWNSCPRKILLCGVNCAQQNPRFRFERTNRWKDFDHVTGGNFQSSWSHFRWPSFFPYLFV